ncbi:MAG TPA: Ig-like domain-containing protein, partial [Gemmatimonadaceae bacterium]
VDGVGPATFLLTVTPAAVASVSVSAPDSSIALGDPALQATVVARDATNNILPLTGRTVVWSSSDPSVATVSASGLITPASAGTSTIGVTVDGVGPATFLLTVTPVAVASVSVTAPDSNLVEGTATQATVVARDAANNILPLTGRTIVWTSSATGVATVSASGLIDAVAAGSATIGVSVDGVGPATFLLTVTPVPVASVSVSAPDSSIALGDPALQATVVARDAANNVLSLTGRTVVWSSSVLGVATISASGLITPVSVGTSIIGVTVDGIGPATFVLTVVP